MTKAISEEVTVITPGPETPKKEKGERGAHLIVLSGHNVGQVFNLTQSVTTIGRDDGSDIQMMDAGISRNHACVNRSDNGTYTLEDAGSRNGTFANNHRVEGVHRLSDGDKVQVGVMTILKFAYTDDPEANYAQQMYEAAHRDGLTGTFNRRYFEERLASEFPTAKRHRRPMGLLMLDLDHFKQVNDNYGHLIGDQVLKEFTAVVTKSIRAEDFVARYGGEEFAVLCRNTDLMQASVLGERIRHNIAGSTFAADSHRLQVTVSIGIAALPDPAITSPSELVDTADGALYRAKQRGRNCVVTKNPDDIF